MTWRTGLSSYKLYHRQTNTTIPQWPACLKYLLLKRSSRMAMAISKPEVALDRSQSLRRNCNAQPQFRVLVAEEG
jgi:hypothetical protein